MKMTQTLVLPGFSPTPLNALTRGTRRARIRLARGDKDLVAWYAREQALVMANGKRRVSLWCSYPPGVRRPDPDGLWKSLLDALVACGLLTGDTCLWVELGGVELVRGEKRETRVTLEDLEV